MNLYFNDDEIDTTVVTTALANEASAALGSLRLAVVDEMPPMSGAYLAAKRFVRAVELLQDMKEDAR